MRVRVEFKPQDFWIGVFWKRTTTIVQPNHGAIDAFVSQLDIWWCIVPMFPIHFTRTRTLVPR